MNKPALSFEVSKGEKRIFPVMIIYALFKVLEKHEFFFLFYGSKLSLFFLFKKQSPHLYFDI
jgi:hypothetical protein